MSYEDLTKDAFEGGVKGLLNWTKDQIKEIAYKCLNWDLGFIGKRETIETIKEQRKREEWLLLDKYVCNKDLRVIVQLGLTLRELEKDVGERDRVKELILKKYGSRGLHIAQFVQNGFLSNYIGIVISRCMSKEALRENLQETLNNIEKFVVFIKGEDDSDKITKILKERIDVLIPKILIIYSSESAMSKAKEIKSNLEKEIEGYYITDMLLDKHKYICFLIRRDREFKEELSYILPQ